MTNYILYITATLKNKITGKKKTISRPFLRHETFLSSLNKFYTPNYDLCKLECKKIYSNGEMQEGV